LGRMGLTLYELYDHTPRQWRNRFEGWQQNERDLYEVLRLLTIENAVICANATGMLKRPLKVGDFIRGARTVEPWSEDEKRRVIERMNKIKFVKSKN
jgi:hypothetical protein